MEGGVLLVAPNTTIDDVISQLEQLRVRGAAGAVTGAHTPETEAPVVASKLAAWQARCREIGAEEGPSIKQCKKVNTFRLPSDQTSLT